MLAGLTKSGVSLLLTTHHLEEAEARCSRTVIIDHGKVIAAGTMPELVDQTVGHHRIVTLRVDAPIASVPPGVDVSVDDPRVLRAKVTHVAGERPPLPSAGSAQGRQGGDGGGRG